MSNEIVVNPIMAQTNMNLSTAIYEVNLIWVNTKEWWINTGATRHICSENKMFSTYNPMSNGEKIFMDKCPFVCTFRWQKALFISKFKMLGVWWVLKTYFSKKVVFSKSTRPPNSQRTFGQFLQKNHFNFQEFLV